MPVVTVEVLVPEAAADAVFARISDFEQYAAHTPAVREITIDGVSDGSSSSTWSVNFRNGVLRWRETDRFDPIARRIEYQQIDGDFETFDGSWQVSQEGSTVRVTFRASFDLGMPTLAPMIDPIAERALKDNITAILVGLLGEQVAPVEPAAGLPVSP